MLRITQQVRRCCQLRGFTLLAALGLLWLTACEGAPARSKPWRHPAEDGPEEPTAHIAGRQAALAALRQDRRSRTRLRVAVIPPAGGSIELTSLDPFAQAPLRWPIAGTVYEGLTRTGGGQITPHLARQIDVAGDGLSLLVTLKSGIVRHDGKPLTNHDVHVSINKARVGSGFLAADLRDIVGIETPGPTQIRLRLRRPNGYVPRMLAEIPIAAAVRGPDGVRAGTGPLAIRAAESPPWQLAPIGGSPAIELVVMPEPGRALAAVQIGDVDIARHVLPQHRVRGGGVRAVELEPARFRYLALNARRNLFSDVEVRRAASLVVDRAALASDGHRGRARPISAPIWPMGPVSATSKAPGPPDRRAAAELLDRSGWLRRDGGARERDKQKLIAVAITGDGEDQAREMVFDQLRESGFVLDVRRLSPKALAGALRRGEFDVALLEWTGFGDWDLSPLLESRGRHNVGGVSSRVLDEALEALRAARSTSDRAAAAPALAAAIDEVVPMVFLTRPIEVVAVGAAVKGALDHPSRLRLGELRRDAE